MVDGITKDVSDIDLTIVISEVNLVGSVRPEKFQFMKKGQNRNFDYKIVISVKNP